MPRASAMVLADDWQQQVERHSLGWVCARHNGDLVGFVNVAWDGSLHAFVIDTLVTASARGEGVGTEMVALCAREARAAGCEWLHVDFDEHLTAFYFDACGFTPTIAGLIELLPRVAAGASRPATGSAASPYPVRL